MRRLYDTRQENAARETFGKHDSGASGFDRMPGGQERLDPQCLALFGEGSVVEAARVFCDQRQRSPKVAARVGEVRVLQQLDLDQRIPPPRTLGTEWGLLAKA